MPAAAISVGTMSTCDVGASSICRARRGVGADPRDRERHTGRLVVQHEPLLVESAVAPEQVAVVGCSHDHRMVGSTVGDRAPYLIDRTIDFGLQPVVHVAGTPGRASRTLG